MSQRARCILCGKIPAVNLGKKFHCQLHGEESQPWQIKCCCIHIKNDSKEEVEKIWNKINDKFLYFQVGFDAAREEATDGNARGFLSNKVLAYCYAEQAWEEKYDVKTYL